MTDKNSLRKMRDHAIGRRIYQTSHRIYLKYNEHLGAYGITFQQFLVLNLLYLNEENGPVNQKFIEAEMELSGPSVTSLIQKMVKKGFLTRSQNRDDARNYDLEITETGRSLHNRCLSAYRQIHFGLIRDIDVRELETLENLLDRIQQNTERIEK